MNLKTILHSYNLDISQPEQNAAWLAINSAAIEQGLKVSKSYSPETYDEKFSDYWKALAPSVGDFPNHHGTLDREIELETDHLFNDQWNTAPCFGSENGWRVMDWQEVVYPDKSIRVGFYVEQTAEMREARRNTYECGYCGKQEPAQKGYVFCPHCIGSELLKPSELHLLRMQSVASREARAPLTDAERAYLLPLYKEAQLHGNTERDKARIAKQRARIARDYDKAIEKAVTERDGFTWLMDHGIKIDNVIYYAHTDKFCFGWRNPIDDVFKNELLEVISEFPFLYEMKCADGRTLSRDA